MARDETELHPRGDTAALPTAEHAAALPTAEHAAARCAGDARTGDERDGADERDASLPVSVEKIVTRDLPHEGSQDHEEI